MKNYQKENSFREKEIILYASLFYDIARTVYIYIYIYARLYLSQHSFNDLNLFRRAISRHGTKRNETKQNKTKTKHTHKHSPSISPLCFR